MEEEGNYEFSGHEEEVVQVGFTTSSFIQDMEREFESPLKLWLRSTRA